MRIAVAQTAGVRLEQWRETLALIDDLIRQAAAQHAQLVLLPECVWPAYCFGRKQDYLDARASGLPEPADFLRHLQRSAHDHHIAICAGHVDEQADRLLNAASLVDADGRLLGTRYKSFLWDFDHDCFEPGERIEPVDAPFGRTGLMVCADARLPEIPATLAARGSQLLLQPTAWVNSGTPAAPWNPQPDFLIAARAAEFGVSIASASKWGAEGDSTFVGCSLMCDAAGRVLVQCGMRETAVIAADIDLAAPRCPALTDAERAILLSTVEPQSPRADVGPLEILPVPPGVDEDAIANWLREKATGPATVVAIQYRAGAPRPDTLSLRVGKHGVLVTGPLSGPFDMSGVRIAAIRAEDAARFAPVRCLALRGAHVIVVFGTETSLPQLKARACENKVFVLLVGADGWCGIDPRGVLVASAAWPPRFPGTTAGPLDVACAANKQVAPRTDVLAGRRPRQYEF